MGRRPLHDLTGPVRALPAWVLRRRGTAGQLSPRSWLLDIGLAAGLALVAILSYLVLVGEIKRVELTTPSAA